MSTYPLTRYRFTFNALNNIALPEYAGSALRGAFGHSLRRVACMTREKECKPCPLYRTCPYPQIFETPAPESHHLQKFSQIPNPYVIEPPTWGEKVYSAGEIFSFELVLFGRSLSQLPLIVLAWQKAMLHGIGRGDGQAELIDIQQCLPTGEVSIFEQGKLLPHDTSLDIGWISDGTSTDAQKQTVDASCLSTLRLQIETPLRLQHNGKPLGPERLSPRELLMALVRRIALLCEFHHTPLSLDFQKFAEQASQIEQNTDLHWLDWTRYSNRQQQKMSLGGVVGEWQLHGNLEPFVPFLYLGQWLHVGKNASFGLGKYTVIGALPPIGQLY